MGDGGRAELGHMRRRRVQLLRMLEDDAWGGGPVAALLAGLLHLGKLRSEEAQLLVPRAWDRVGRPMGLLTREQWVALFRCGGYTHEFEPAERPDRAQRLFRGSDAAGALGMCWSANVDVARWLASGYDDGHVWSAAVEPWRLLAFMATGYEDQFVVDTQGLERQMELVEGPEEIAALDLEELGLRLDAVADGGVCL